tara:strand:- start:190 stop:1305 length:1116 start_codon:yes stop_codon:yes gene_type:complete
MKKLFAISFISSSLIFGVPHAKSDWDYYGIINAGQSNKNAESASLQIYLINSQNGSSNKVYSYCQDLIHMSAENSYSCRNEGDAHYVNSLTGELIINTDNNNFKVFDPVSGNLTENSIPNWEDSYDKVFQRPNFIVDSEGNTILTISGNKLLEKKASGEMHIGENSWITKEENGRQKVWAEDAAGNSIPIDYTNGTKLLINGRDVEQSINNVGALSAALTGLPTVPTDTSLACGLGTGTHGGDFAFSGGCASKVNEKLSINYAASMRMPGQDYAGDFEDAFSARAGFVWKLGKSNKPTKISVNQKKEIDLKISKLENDNELLKADNKKLNAKNNEIISRNEQLLKRLEKLENIAFDLQKNKDFRLSQSISE